MKIFPIKFAENAEKGRKMPRFDSLAIVSDKQAVILDIGTAYTKCGFASEFVPRAIIPSVYEEYETRTKYPVFDTKRSKEEQIRILSKFIHQIYYKYLLAVPKERRVLIVESVLCASVERELIAFVLFEHFDVPSLLFAPNHLLACFPFKTQDALVVDIGYTETVVLPIYECVPMLNCWSASPLAANAIHSNLMSLLKEEATIDTSHLGQLSINQCQDVLKDNIIQDIKVRTCFVTHMDRGRKIQAARNDSSLQDQLPTPPHDVSYPIEGDKTLIIPGRIRESATEVLFEYGEDTKSIPQLILDSVVRCPIDLRRPLLESICVIGGSCMLPGFVSRLKSELLYLLETKYKHKLPLHNVKFYQYKNTKMENYMAWLGGSMFGSLEILPYRSVSREDYQKNPHIPDWTDKIDENIGSEEEGKKGL